VANSQDDSAPSQHPDLLAAVVLHTLVSEGRDGMTVADVARACERDPEDTADRKEVETALGILLEDGLAEHVADDEHDQGAVGLIRPTRAAVRASELSF
jgi:hypothetical protein